MGITFYGSNPNSPIERVIIDNNHIHHCDPADSEALVLNGNIRKFEVTRNTVHDVNNIGIDFIGGEAWIGGGVVRDGLCRQNVVYRARHAKGYAAGIYVDGALAMAIENNEVYDCDLGIEVGAENAGIETSKILVQHNHLHDNTMPGLVFGGFKEEAGRVKNCTFKNNLLRHPSSPS